MIIEADATDWMAVLAHFVVVEADQAKGQHRTMLSAVLEWRYGRAAQMRKPLFDYPQVLLNIL